MVFGYCAGLYILWQSSTMGQGTLTHSNQPLKIYFIPHNRINSLIAGLNLKIIVYLQRQ